MMDRSFTSDSREQARLPGAVNFFSLSFATVIGSKSANTSLNKFIGGKFTIGNRNMRGKKVKCIVPE